MHVEVQLLGRLEVRLHGRTLDLGAPKQRAVLAILLLECGRIVSTDRLLELVWPDSLGSSSSLQTYISNLRRALEPDRPARAPNTVLVTSPPGYFLAIDRHGLDAFRFEDQVSLGADRLRAGDVHGGLESLERALQEWRGPLLPELADEPYVIAAATRLQGIRSHALALTAQARLDLRDHHGAVALVESALDEFPLDERLHGILALGLYRSGRQADALRVIDHLRRALAESAGLQPGSEIRTLEADLLAQAPSLDVAPAPPVATVPTPSGWDAPRGSTDPVVDRAAPPGPNLVGRHRELEILHDRLAHVRSGRGRVVVLTGEAGIGKTRLTEELVRLADAHGVVTASVRCPENQAIPSFWPIVKLAEALLASGAIRRGVPLPTAVSRESPSTLFALYESIVEQVRAADQPLVMVIDDLQWCDADSLRLLAHVAPSLADLDVLLVVALRPLEEANHALVDALAELSRVRDSATLELDGLSLQDVSEWLASRHRGAVPSAVASIVHDRTSGNPLFVKELCELLDADGAGDATSLIRATRAIPRGVQFVVRRRVARLPAPTQQLLSAASVVGRNFDADVLATVTDTAPATVLDLLEPAVAAGLVLEDRPAAFRFSHALVAEALAAELDGPRRARLHADTAQALADRSGPRFGDRGALVAHHAIRGCLAGSGDLAVEASAEAARRAAGRFGFEEASVHWERAVEMLDTVRPGDLRARVEATYELAAARFDADMVRPAKQTALDTLALAEQLDDVAVLVRVAALLGRPHLWPNQGYGEVDGRAVAALQRVLAVIDEADHAGRALVLGALALELIYADEEHFTRTREAALTAARAARDPEVLARILVNVAGPLRPTELAERERLAEEVIALSRSHDLPIEIEMVGWFHLAIARWDAADFDRAASHLETCRALSQRVDGGVIHAQLTVFRAATAIVRGQWDDALRLARDADERYRRTREIDADLIVSTLLIAHAADRGGLEQAIELVATLDADRLGPVVAAFHAWALAEIGDLETAAVVIARVDPSRPVPNDYVMLCVTALSLHVWAELGHPEPVRVLAARLAPYRGRWTQAGSGGISAGLVDLALARAAALEGDAVSAVDLFESAVTGHERLRAPAWLARSLIHFGEYLVRTGDRDRGMAALERARELVDAHGLVSLARRLEDQSGSP